MKLVIHTDGGSRGNPGQAGIGVVIESIVNGQRSIVTKFGKRIGIKTNNEAEYMAVIEALGEVLRKKITKVDGIDFVLDSLLVVNQLNGSYKVKQAHLQELLLKIRSLEQQVSFPTSYRHVLRHENREADRLVNEALDTP